MCGQDAVSPRRAQAIFYRTRILSEGTRNVLRAMETHGVQRFVCETALGVGDSAGRMGLYYTFFVIPIVLPFYFWDKTRQERLIAASRVKWIIVRPGALTNGAKRGRYRQGRAVGEASCGPSRISRADGQAESHVEPDDRQYVPQRCAGRCFGSAVSSITGESYRFRRLT